jgi:hypothetical protein
MKFLQHYKGLAALGRAGPDAHGDLAGMYSGLTRL